MINHDQYSEPVASDDKFDEALAALVACSAWNETLKEMRRDIPALSA